MTQQARPKIPKSILVVDVSVLKYQFYHSGVKLFNPRVHTRDVAHRWYTNKFIDVINKFTDASTLPVLVFDKKFQMSNGEQGYWRTEFINRRQEFYSTLTQPKRKTKKAKADYQGYKGQRPEADSYAVLLDYITEAMHDLKKLYPSFEYPGTEADDQVGLLCKYLPEELSLNMLTVDRDWCFLTNDDSGITWTNLHAKSWGVTEGEAEALEYYQQKLDKTLIDLKDVPRAKSVKGDVGDNLPPGSDIEVIDLFFHCAPVKVSTSVGPDLTLEFPDFVNAHKNVQDFYTQVLSGNHPQFNSK